MSVDEATEALIKAIQNKPDEPPLEAAAVLLCSTIKSLERIAETLERIETIMKTPS